MTTEPTTTIEQRVSKLEGAYEQANERFNDQTQAINALRTETRSEISSVRAEIAEFRAETRAEIAEVRTEIAELRSAMHRQTYLVIAVLGGLVTLLRFIG